MHYESISAKNLIGLKLRMFGSEKLSTFTVIGTNLPEGVFATIKNMD